MQLKIWNTDNEAFGDTDESQGEEIARIISSVAERILDGQKSGGCWDSNGNPVGEWSL